MDNASRVNSRMRIQSRERDFEDVQASHYIGSLEGAWNDGLKLENILKWKYKASIERLPREGRKGLCIQRGYS